MRIAIARSGPLGGDGVSRVIECWARILGQAGHATTVVSESSVTAASLPDLPGVRGLQVAAARGVRSTRLFVAARAAAGRIREMAEHDGLDLIISHNSLLTVAIRRSLPDIPLLGTFHSPVVDEHRLNNWKYARSLTRKLTYPATSLILWRAERQALAAVSAVHTLSDFTWDKLSARYPEVCSRAAWHKIPGSFDHERFTPSVDRTRLRTELGFAAHETVLLTVRRLVPRNGVDRIVRCAKELHGKLEDVRFLIGGTGEQEGELRQEIRSAGLSDVVQLLGFIPEDRLAPYYQAADAFLLPTRDLECFGLPVIEAMACGCLPLVMPEGGPAEVCRQHPEWIAQANTDQAFTELVWRYLSGGIPRRVPGIERIALEAYSDEAIRPRVLELVDALATM